MSSLKRSRNEPENDVVYFLLGYHRGTVGYRICKFDVSAIDESHNHHGNQSSSVALPPKPFTPVFELPRELYPECMGAFSLGSKIYMLGGEIPLPGSRHPSGLKHWLRLSEKVYVFDTDSTRGKRKEDTDLTGSGSSFINLLEVGPPMNGGKTRPFPIHVDGKVYVISQLPAGWIRFDEEYPAVLFEVFDPNYKNNRNEGKGGGGKWSTLPNPPFYPDMSQPGILDYGWIVSHAVVGSTIFFRVEGKRKCIYTFDVVGDKWECFDLLLHFPERELGCFKGAVQVSDSVWAFIGNSRSLVHTYNPRADFGMVGRTVEDLDGVSLLADTLPLLCRDMELLCLKNGRLCVLQICLDEEYNKPGKKLYVLASVFSVVEKRVDKVSRREVVPWPPHMYTPDETHWTSEEVGEIEVFGSIGLRSSLFAVDEEGSGENYYLLGCFPA